MNSELLTQNLLAPAVLAFAVGVVARLCRSDLAFPEAISQGLAIYLLFAIGLKGGQALDTVDPLAVVLPALATIALGCLTAWISFAAAQRIGRLGRPDAAAFAAHFGSTSAVTFLAASAYLYHRGIPFEGFLPALLVIMEIPGIAIALALAGRTEAGGLWPALGRVAASKSIVLLLGGMLVGWMANREGLEKTAGFFVAPFVGVLCLFLLDLGTVAADRLKAIGRGFAPLVALGIALPLVNGTLGAAVGTLVGLNPGGATLLAVLCASASYIAAPAAVRSALPQADLGRCLAIAIGVTFPFNLALGIPLYTWLAQSFAGWRG